jgi:nucleoid-associated protein YgaU
MGGAVSLADLRTEAAATAERMRSMHRDMRRQKTNASLHEAFNAAARELRSTQLLIAGETGAAGLYQLRPEDTLAAVAHRVLGDSLQWGKIYEKNRYVLENPDRLIAGITLVLP